MALSDIDKSPLYIDSTNSRVGIGTTSANKSSSSTALTVNTSSAGNYSALELSSGDTLNWYINSNNAAVYDVTAGTRPRIFYTNGAERMRIDSSGKVGIGTVAPDLALHVEGTNAAPASSGSTPTGFLSLRQKDGGASHGANIGVLGVPPWGTWIQGQDANNLATSYPLLLNPNGGNVGIGTSSPAYNLDVYNPASTGAPLLARFKSAGGDTQLYVDNSTITTQLTADSFSNSGIVGTLTNHPFVFRTNNTERMRILASGGITFNGDTAAANALDDYEEGTITNLRIYFDTNLSSTSSTGASYVTASGGIYTKIGRLVTVQFYWSGTYNANQVVLKHMENLPFTVGSSNNGFYGGNTSIPYHRGFSGYYRYNTSTDYTNNINLIVTPGTTTATFKSWAHSFISTGFPLMNAGAGQELSASLTYMTD